MLTVTTNAKSKLEGLLRDRQPEPGMAVRISISSAGGQLQLAWDREREEDRVLEGDQGEKLLLVGPDVAPTVATSVMDYQELPQGQVFTIVPAAEEPESK